MDYWGWKPYVPVAARRKKAEAAAKRAHKAGAALAPVAASRGAIAKTFWGKAWCDNLEQYSDYANRLPRGRTYVRNGSVIDLIIAEGEVRAQVMGSDLYRVEVRVAAVGDRHWKAIGADCAGSIDSMVELLQGRFSQAVMQRLCRPGDGLFPAPRELQFSCSCPDWASMCKHVAAVLYGVGARLDSQPELLFKLRRVDGAELLAQADQVIAAPAKRPAGSRVLQDSALADVFGIEMAGVAAAPVVPLAAKTPAPDRSGAQARQPAPRAASALPKARGGAQVAAAPKGGANAKAKRTTAPKVKAETNTKTQAAATNAAGVKAKPRAQTGARTGAKSRTGIEAKTKTKTKTKAKPKLKSSA